MDGWDAAKWVAELVAVAGWLWLVGRAASGWVGAKKIFGKTGEVP